MRSLPFQSLNRANPLSHFKNSIPLLFSCVVSIAQSRKSSFTHEGATADANQFAAVSIAQSRKSSFTHDPDALDLITDKLSFNRSIAQILFHTKSMSSMGLRSLCVSIAQSRKSSFTRYQFSSVFSDFVEFQSLNRVNPLSH